MPVVDVKVGSVVPERAAEGVERSRHMEDELREQNERFSAAVENMSHGLCMFDADERMIICNGNYINIFCLDAKLIRPGIRFIDILRHSVDIGIASQSADELYAIRKPYIDQAKPSTYEETLSDGRIVNISHRAAGSGRLGLDLRGHHRAAPRRAGARRSSTAASTPRSPTCRKAC